MQKNVIVLNYSKSWIDPVFDQVSGGITHIIKGHRFGVGAFHSGDEVFGWNTAYAAYSRNSGPYAFGIRSNYHRIHAEGSGQIHQLTFDAGLQWSIDDDFTMGFMIRNIHWNNMWLDNHPIAIGLGTQWKATQYLICNLDILYSGSQLRNGLGIQWRFHEHLVWNIGYSTTPGRFTTGFEYVGDKIIIGFSGNYQPNYGIHQQASAVYLY